MVVIELRLTDKQAREWLYYLRRRFNSKKAGLKKLIRFACIKEVAVQAKNDLEEINGETKK